MIPHIRSVSQVGPYRLVSEFDDDAAGELNFQEFLRFEGGFEPLEDPAYFFQVAVDSEAGTIMWPNGADLDPLGLHSRVTGKPVKFDVPASHR